MIDVGVRSSYVASWLAAPIMARQGQGLIVFTSASGAAHYLMGPPDGAHKAGSDKMAFDMAVASRRHIATPMGLPHVHHSLVIR